MLCPCCEPLGGQEEEQQLQCGCAHVADAGGHRQAVRPLLVLAWQEHALVAARCSIQLVLFDCGSSSTAKWVWSSGVLVV